MSAKHTPQAWWRLSIFEVCRPCVTTDAEEAADWRAEGHDVRELGDVSELRAVNAKLLEALRQIAELRDFWSDGQHAANIARAAIARAETKP